MTRHTSSETYHWVLCSHSNEQFQERTLPTIDWVDTINSQYYVEFREWIRGEVLCFRDMPRSLVCRGSCCVTISGFPDWHFIPFLEIRLAMRFLITDKINTVTDKIKICPPFRAFDIDYQNIFSELSACDNPTSFGMWSVFDKYELQ